MAEALDRRDTAGRDPSFYAAKALESTIKIICDIRNWTNGNEKSVSDFLNHLESKANGAFIEGWERQSIQRFYSGGCPEFCVNGASVNSSASFPQTGW